MDRVKLVVIGLSTFVCGLALGLCYAAYLYKQDQAFILTLLESRSVDNAREIATRLKTIEAAQNHDASWIISFNCSRIRATLPFVHLDLFPEGRRAEWADLFQRAGSKVQELEHDQMCPSKPAV